MKKGLCFLTVWRELKAMLSDTSTTKITLRGLGLLPGRKEKKRTGNIRSIDSSRIAADTHTGFVRTVNEDNYAFCSKKDGLLTFAMVADGIGGQSHGDLAAMLCCSRMMTEWREFTAGRADVPLADAKDFLSEAIDRTGAFILKRSSEMHFLMPMGTTIVSMLFADRHYITAHAGDSRAYLLRGGELKLLTRDHSFIEELIRKGVLDRKDAQGHPYAHVISKSVGIQETVDPELSTGEYFPEDKFLLCSDGLTLHLSNEEIRNILAASNDPEECVHNLMNTALRRGGGDNITLVAVFP